MLPHVFPPFPDRKDFDLYASMHPAREIGGDFYDFFFTDDDHLFSVIADVSGKGVPAALFMVVTKTLLKNNARTGLTPAGILNKTNAQLAEGNDAQMFVTVFIGCLELSTGRFTFANAGHNPPVIKRKDKRREFLKSKHGFVCALLDNIKYTDNEIVLDKGDALFLYTDGVTEAQNTEGFFFGNARLLESLSSVPVDAGVCEIENAVERDIRVFAGGAEQADDIAMLVLKYIGSE